MESVEIIVEPNRRAILNLLVSSQQPVGEIEGQLRMPQPTVSKHLRVVHDAGYVESTAGRIVAGEAMKFGWLRLNSEYAKQFGIETPNWPPQAAQKS